MVDVTGFQLADEAVGSDDEETGLLLAQFQAARTYLSAFSWSEPVECVYLAFGVGGVFALFLFVFERPVGGSDKELWVVTGDLPSAYFVVDDAQTVDAAIETYCALMEDWVAAAKRGDEDADVFPVNVSRTPDNAEDLKRRIVFLRETFL